MAAPDVLITPAVEESPLLLDLLERVKELICVERVGMLRNPDGSVTEIPASALAALQVAAEAMAQGNSIVVTPIEAELTTQTAAEILGVSRPHLIKLLDRGELPYHRTGKGVGAHRRVLLHDVLAYRDTRRATRRGLLQELTRASQDARSGYT